MNATIESLEQRNMRTDLPQFKAGDTVRVHFKVIEGQRQRIQMFEGIVIKRQGAGARETFTVRKQSFGVGVERTFPLHSPKIERIDVVSVGDVRGAAETTELADEGATAPIDLGEPADEAVADAPAVEAAADTDPVDETAG